MANLYGNLILQQGCYYECRKGIRDPFLLTDNPKIRVIAFNCVFRLLSVSSHGRYNQSLLRIVK